MGSEFWEEGVGTDFVNGCQWPVRDVSAEAAYAHTMCMCVLWLVNFLELVGYVHAFGTLSLGVFVRPAQRRKYALLVVPSATRCWTTLNPFYPRFILLGPSAHWACGTYGAYPCMCLSFLPHMFWQAMCMVLP